MTIDRPESSWNLLLSDLKALTELAGTLVSAVPAGSFGFMEIEEAGRNQDPSLERSVEGAHESSHSLLVASIDCTRQLGLLMERDPSSTVAGLGIVRAALENAAVHQWLTEPSLSLERRARRWEILQIEEAMHAKRSPREANKQIGADLLAEVRERCEDRGWLVSATKRTVNKEGLPSPDDLIRPVMKRSDEPPRDEDLGGLRWWIWSGVAATSIFGALQGPLHTPGALGHEAPCALADAVMLMVFCAHGLSVAVDRHLSLGDGESQRWNDAMSRFQGRAIEAAQALSPLH